MFFESTEINNKQKQLYHRPLPSDKEIPDSQRMHGGTKERHGQRARPPSPPLLPRAAGRDLGNEEYTSHGPTFPSSRLVLWFYIVFLSV